MFEESNLTYQERTTIQDPKKTTGRTTSGFCHKTFPFSSEIQKQWIDILNKGIEKQKGKESSEKTIK